MEMNIKEMLAQLATTTQKAEIENVLQQTTAQLLHHYKIRAREVELYPIELESYFYRAGVFEDPYVHTNELQANHFGELYVHRRGKEASSPYKMDNRVCMGISLSVNANYYYSALIRSAVFADGSMVFGPNNVLMHFMRGVNASANLLDAHFFDTHHAGTFVLAPLFHCVEGQQVLFEVDAATDPRDKSYLMYGSRIGLGDADPHYQQLSLRAAIGKLSTPFAFKEKTQLLNNYLAERKLRGDAAKLLAKEMRQECASAGV